MKSKHKQAAIIVIALITFFFILIKKEWGGANHNATDVKNNTNHEQNNIGNPGNDQIVKKSRASFQDEFQKNLDQWNSQEDNDYLEKKLVALFHEWFVNYPDDAFAAIALLKFSNHRLVALEKCLGRVSHSVEELYNLSESLLSGRDLYRFQEALMSKHDTNDFHETENFVNSKIDSVNLKILFYRNWCKKSPMDAAISINRLDPEKARVVIGYFTDEFSKFPLNNFKEIYDSNPKSDCLKIIASDMLLEQMNNGKMAELQSFFQREPTFKEQSKKVIEVISTEDPQKLFDHWDFLMKNDFLDVKSPYMVRTISNLVSSNNDIVDEFYSRMSETKQDKAVVASLIAESYVYSDLDKAAEWIIHLPSGKEKVAAVEPLLMYLQERNEKAEYAKWKEYQNSLKNK